VFVVGLGVAVLVVAGGSAGAVRPASSARQVASSRIATAVATRPAFASLAHSAKRPLAASITGPVDPPPGGYTLSASSFVQAPLLVSPGQTWTFTALDMSRFDNLWWGPFDTSGTSIGVSTCTNFTFDSSQPGLSNGIATWSATTNSNISWGSFQCTFTLTVTDINGVALPLIASSNLGLTQGAVVRVPSSGSFKANMYISIFGQSNTILWIDNNRQSLFSSGSTPMTQSDFTGGWFYQPDAPAAVAVNANATEGASFSGQVATINDGDSTSTNSEYSATVDWGDGSVTAGTITGPAGGPFAVSGGHTWADEGSFPVTVSISDGDNAGANTAAAGTATVLEADGLTSTGSIAITTASDGSFSGAVSGFTNTSTINVASDFAATINWGDSTTNPGIVNVSAGNLTVSGSHTYASTGAYSVSVQVQDDAPGTASGAASGTANFNPSAAADTYSGTTNQALNVAAPGVLQNDTGASLTAQQLSSPSSGSLVLNPNGSFSYTPNNGFSGTDSFQYRACSNGACSATTTATLNIAPVANSDSYGTNYQQALNITAPGVLGNDLGTSLAAAVVSGPANGALTLNSNGSFSYTPNNGFSGTDTFVYRACTGAVCSIGATVTITVASPVIANPDSYTTGYGKKLIVAAPGVLANDTGSGITVTSITTLPQHGSLTMQPNGSFTYVPAAGFTGNDSFKYSITDSHGTASSPGLVTIAVIPTAAAHSYTTTAGHTRSVAAPGVLSGGRGVGSLGASPVSPPSHGSLTLNANGSFTYVPQAGFSGIDSFTYRITDSNGMQSLPATVTINVLPVALNDKYRAKAGSTLSVAAPGVLGNDIGTGLQASLVSGPTHGVLTLNSDGSLSYTPAAGFSGIDSFTYKAVDSSSLASAAAMVTITVFPVAVADSYVTPRDVPLVVSAGSGVLANDLGTGLTLGSVTALPTHGSLTISSDGSFTYTPNFGYVGSDSFKYTCRDSAGNLSAPATVTISVL
jgi:hypothetical protein